MAHAHGPAPQGLDAFFAPRGVAVVGASAEPGGPGHQIVAQLQRTHYTGGIYPVNPRATEVLGLPCYPSVLQVPGPVDLAVVVVPAPACLVVAAQLAARRHQRGDAAAAVVVSGGFAEVGDAGRQLQDQLVRTLRTAGIRLVGPNCVGVADAHVGLTTSFDLGPYPAGGASLLSQSGAFAMSFLQWARPLEMVGLCKLASVGNMADVTLTELLAYLADDRCTRVVGVYLEGVADARAFVQTAARVGRDKPVVVLKPGRTEQGARAAHSHTGSVASADAIYDGAFRQAGVVRARTVSEFYGAVRAFERLPLPPGNRVAVLSAVGGPGTICVDEVAAQPGLQLAHFSPRTRERLGAVLSNLAAVGQPEGYVDMTGAVVAHTHGDALRILLEDEGVDAVVLLTPPPAFLDEEEVARSILQAYRDQPEGRRKPVLAVITFGDAALAARRILEKGGLCTFEFPEEAVRVLARMVEYARARERLRS
ncbi:MAG: CoA-binding protein [Firmicutes bacterium]|nr:CoA-binding protein [Bacillota bacterium]